MPRQNFDEIALKQFAYLVDDFGFHLAETRNSSNGCVILFITEIVGVRISYEFREAFVHVMLYKLSAGKIHENPRPIKKDSLLNGYSLEDIVSIRAPGDAVRPAYSYGETSEFYDPDRGLELYVERFAENLKKHASDVLRGDFHIFSKLHTLVVSRAEQLRKSHHG